MKRKLLIAIFPLFFLLYSCLGLSADIVLNRNGSGTIALEYSVSKSLDALGKLDGNERWNTIPVGKADFERTLDRLPDMKLLSFSSKEDATNLVVSVKMEFASIRGLLAFLDAGGQRASFSGDAGSGSLILVLNESAAGASTFAQGSSLQNLVKDISEGYQVGMSMSFPGEGKLSVSDNRGTPLSTVPGGKINPKGKKVSCSIPLYEVLSATNGMKIEFSW